MSTEGSAEHIQILRTATTRMSTWVNLLHFIFNFSVLLYTFHYKKYLHGSKAKSTEWGTLPSILVTPSLVSQFSHSVVSDSLRPHELQRTRPPCPSSTPGVYSNSCPSSRWCHPAISSSVVPFSSCPQSLPASGSFPMSQLFAWGGQSTGVSAAASVLPMNTQD